jgi:hypothetical protein
MRHHHTQHSDIQPNDTQYEWLISVIMTLSITKLCHYAECRDLFIGVLNVIMLIVVAPKMPG